MQGDAVLSFDQLGIESSGDAVFRIRSSFGAGPHTRRPGRAVADASGGRNADCRLQLGYGLPGGVVVGEPQFRVDADRRGIGHAPTAHERMRVRLYRASSSPGRRPSTRATPSHARPATGSARWRTNPGGQPRAQPDDGQADSDRRKIGVTVGHLLPRFAPGRSSEPACRGTETIRPTEGGATHESEGRCVQSSGAKPRARLAKGRSRPRWG